MIALEGLNLNFMFRNRNLVRAAHDVSIGIFGELLAYGSERVHDYPHCGFIVDRDVNAARNILSWSERDCQAKTWAVGLSIT